MCTPLASAVVSNVKWPPAAALFVKPANAPAMSLRTSPKTTGCSGPESIETCTPVAGTVHVVPPEFGVKAQPKFTTAPLAVPPMAGVSIDPNGLFADAFATPMVFWPSVVTCPSASNAIACSV